MKEEKQKWQFEFVNPNTLEETKRLLHEIIVEKLLTMQEREITQAQNITQ